MPISVPTKATEAPLWAATNRLTAALLLCGICSLANLVGCGADDSTVVTPAATAGQMTTANPNATTTTDSSSTDGTEPAAAGMPVLSLQSGIGSIPMSGCVADDYFAAINVGGQTLNMLIDSGSSTMALALSSCSTCSPAHVYSPSTTAKRIGKTVGSTYGDGSSWTGITYSDQVAIGGTGMLVTPTVGITFAAITRANHFFNTVDTCSPTADVAFDGIFGVGPDSQLVTGTTSFLTAVAATGKLAHNAFAVQTCDVGGTLMLGGYNANAILSNPNYTPMTTNGPLQAYQMQVSAMSLGNTDFGVAPSALGPMVVDNGTNALLVSKAVFEKFESLLEANATYQSAFGTGFISATSASCASASGGLTRAQLDAALPKLTFTLPKVGGGTFNVTLPATSSYLVAGSLATSGGSKATVYCPAITESSTFIFGNAAMRGHVVIFDRENSQVGFAPQKGCSQSSVTYSNGT